MENQGMPQFARRLDIEGNELHVLCPAGSGDFAWVWSKWWSVAAERKVTFWFPHDEQHRAGGVAQCYGANYGYLRGLTTNWVWSQDGQPEIPDSGAVLTVHANRHLENGSRIESWYRNLPFRTPRPDSLAVTYKGEAGSPQYIVAFTCHEGYMEGNLLPGMWARLFSEVEQAIGTPVMLVGADKDVPFIERVLEIFDPSVSPALNVPLQELVPYLAGAKACIGAASGITILSAYCDVPTVHGYPRWLARMKGMWEHGGARSISLFLDEFVLPCVPKKLKSLINGEDTQFANYGTYDYFVEMHNRANGANGTGKELATAHTTTHQRVKSE